jgi:hypothetical protein
MMSLNTPNVPKKSWDGGKKKKKKTHDVIGGDGKGCGKCHWHKKPVWQNVIGSKNR